MHRAVDAPGDATRPDQTIAAVRVHRSPPRWTPFSRVASPSASLRGNSNARTQTSYQADGRPSRVRVSSCSHPEAAFEADLEPSDPQDFNEALVLVPVPPDALKGEANCVRFTILATRPGKDPGVCISEIVPTW